MESALLLAGRPIQFSPRCRAPPSVRRAGDWSWDRSVPGPPAGGSRECSYAYAPLTECAFQVAYVLRKR